MTYVLEILKLGRCFRKLLLFVNLLIKKLSRVSEACCFAVSVMAWLGLYQESGREIKIWMNGFVKFLISTNVLDTCTHFFPFTFTFLFIHFFLHINIFFTKQGVEQTTRLFDWRDDKNIRNSQIFTCKAVLGLFHQFNMYFSQ